MKRDSLPIFYSFRRCPYAMRARLALVSSKQRVHLREINLKEKPTTFLMDSPSGTVPCLVFGKTIIDESLDIMIWALKNNDPDDWLLVPETSYNIISRCATEFKDSLDKTKYASRFPHLNPLKSRSNCCRFLKDLDEKLKNPFLFGPSPKITDMAIFPFVRQFAFIDKVWFDSQNWENLKRWLESLLNCEEFHNIQKKYAFWPTNSNLDIFP